MADHQRARIEFDPRFTVADVPERLFGSFVEHLGRCVYTGIYEPDHASANEDGLRQDVLDLIRELGPTMIRYPGGNFVSGYRWEDGVGPKEDRPRRLDLAWGVTETNQFGLGEFMKFCRTVGVEPNMAVNLGTRGLQEALDLLEYANHPGGTYWSDLRRSHGDEEPYGIKLWCLGNEMDGPWQIGQRTATEYGRIADQVARSMRMIDDKLDLVACGSSSRGMPQFGAWEAEVLTQSYESVDYISAHAYYQPEGGDFASFMASAQDMELFIDGVIATADAVGAKLKSDKKINISFDEWNVWYQHAWHEAEHAKWVEAPRQLEDVYSAMDAVVFGSLLITLLRRCDRVTAACLAQLVNVIAPIMTEPGGPAWRQTTFFPFAEASKFGRGKVLRVNADAPAFHTERFGDVAALHSVAVANEDGSITVFAVNRNLEHPLTLEIDAASLPTFSDLTCSTLTDEDPNAKNTLENPTRVAPKANEDITVKDGVIAIELPAMSWNTIRIA
ncbi:alpha-N-arabinofuranosidase [Glycomyces sp. TRM65418]|uniref:arabinosylfuranosidase ArfA n=1 Tax=Glycomyces sp. TRM65418 TaxID=2867006 RepID=UPI001CE624CB|nr:alpha-N-arabinofuranosidase [Glycomyces sp. TRM65418]MCC3763191.1 alpha-N-arabinofuranosidase [Glycomyces sp. TRM65418]QZD57195.1 alpha-N-arabinofuranosidase [Glycomyces sp. TRM65418]